jgi:hypothetical protein
MVTSKETGHAKNVANFNNLTTTIIGFGSTYNPARESIKTAALQSVYSAADKAVKDVNDLEPGYAIAINARQIAFKPLGPLITRVANALKAFGTSPETDEQVYSIVRKLRGTRATPRLTDEEKKALESEGKSVTEHSSSQQGFDSQLNNLYRFIQLLGSVPEYAPNEPELKTEALNELYTELDAKNKAVAEAANPLDLARIRRDSMLYKTGTGLVDIAGDAKNYVKSVFGAGSREYKLVSKIQFKDVKL